MYKHFMSRSDDLPIVQLSVNCDTILAINTAEFNIQQNDELIFTIKNYDYIGAPAIFLKRICATEINSADEALFKVPPDIVQHIKPCAFWNISVLRNVYDAEKPTQHMRLTGNGRVTIAYGAPYLDTQSQPFEPDEDTAGIHLIPIEE